MITLNTNPGLLRTAVYERILSDLQQGAIAPGETISLNKLAETLNISKTPLRDALLELQAEGFVTLYPQRGVMVNALSEEEKREKVVAAGGLYIIGTERHEARRIDNQLRGIFIGAGVAAVCAGTAFFLIRRIRARRRKKQAEMDELAQQYADEDEEP